MVDVIVFIVASIVALGGFFLTLWTATTIRQDARIAQLERDARTHSDGLVAGHVRLEGLEARLAIDGPVDVRLARLETFMRPAGGELAPRLAQLEQQQAVDSRAFAEQHRIHNRQIKDLALRMQAMARDMVTRGSLEQTWPAPPIDRERPTVRPAR